MEKQNYFFLALVALVFSCRTQYSKASEILPILAEGFGNCKKINDETWAKINTPSFEHVLKNECSTFQNYSVQEKRDHFYLIDLDQNGTNEIIYSGSCKPEIQVLVFQFVNDTAKLILSTEGMLTKGEENYFRVRKNACCCMEATFIRKFTMKNEKLEITEEILIPKGLALPVLAPNAQKQECENIVLRSEAEINDSIFESPCKRGEFITGNQYFKMDGKSEFLILHEKGNGWKLVSYQNKEAKKLITRIGWIEP